MRIQIVDRKEDPIFPMGSAALTDEAKRVLSLVATSMKNLPNQVIIEGHTDASHTRNEEISNWELSTLRACSARRELENCGFDPFRISRVAGYADKVPLERMRAWETALMRYMDSSHREIMKSIAEDKRITAEVEPHLTPALETFSSSWQ